MKTTKYIMAMAVVALFIAVPVWAADEVRKSTGKIFEDFLPLLIIFGLLYIFLRRHGRKNAPYMDRAMIHMDRIERQNDEIIMRLKEIADKKSIPEQNPPPLPRVPAGHSEGEG